MNIPTIGSAQHPVAVIGAGPVGLAAAAYLLRRGIEPLVLEAGTTVGSNLLSVAHVPLFSPWRYNIDAEARRLLLGTGWREPDPDILPTAGGLVREYLEPLARHPELRERIRYGARVAAVTRAGVDKVRTAGREHVPFRLRIESAAGHAEDVLAAAVIDASGTWATPNPLGADGLPARGEMGAGEYIAYGMPDVLGDAREDYAGRDVLVVGAGHSAAGTLLALDELARQAPGTRVHWAVRGKAPRRVFGGGADDALPARGALGERVRTLVTSGRVHLHTDFAIQAVQPTARGLRVTPAGGTGALTGIDRIIAATGARPNLRLTRELRVRLDPALECVEALAPLIDPNEHDCGTVPPHGHRELEHPEPGFFIAGAKSYGRAPTFLMMTGHAQVRSIVDALAGDTAAADDVTLELPATGACATGRAAGAPDGAGAPVCCGTSGTGGHG